MAVHTIPGFMVNSVGRSKQSFIVVRARPRRLARLARSMRRAGLPEHAIARALRVSRHRLDGWLAGNDLFTAAMLASMRAEAVTFSGGRSQ